MPHGYLTVSIVQALATYWGTEGAFKFLDAEPVKESEPAIFGGVTKSVRNKSGQSQA